MPFVPSRYVIDDRHAAVFMKAGSYVIRPKSSSATRMARKSSARTVPSVIGISYVRPVRLSVTLSVSEPVPSTEPLPTCALSPGDGCSMSLGELTSANYAPRPPFSDVELGKFRRRAHPSRLRTSADRVPASSEGDVHGGRDRRQHQHHADAHDAAGGSGVAREC